MKKSQLLPINFPLSSVYTGHCRKTKSRVSRVDRCAGENVGISRFTNSTADGAADQRNHDLPGSTGTGQLESGYKELVS